MDIAKRITELFEEAGENRKEFLAHTGIPVRTLVDWEAGRRTPAGIYSAADRVSDKIREANKEINLGLIASNSRRLKVKSD